MKQTKNDNILILIITLCFVFIFWAYGTTEDLTVKVQIITAVLAILSITVNWRYGSSKSSMNKDETIKQLQEENKTPTVKTDTLNAENIENVTANTVKQGGAD